MSWFDCVLASFFFGFSAPPTTLEYLFCSSPHSFQVQSIVSNDVTLVGI